MKMMRLIDLTKTLLMMTYFALNLYTVKIQQNMCDIAMMYGGVHFELPQYMVFL